MVRVVTANPGPPGPRLRSRTHELRWLGRPWAWEGASHVASRQGGPSCLASQLVEVPFSLTPVTHAGGRPSPRPALGLTSLQRGRRSISRPAPGAPRPGRPLGRAWAFSYFGAGRFPHTWSPAPVPASQAPGTCSPPSSSVLPPWLRDGSRRVCLQDPLLPQPRLLLHSQRPQTHLHVSAGEGPLVAAELWGLPGACGRIPNRLSQLPHLRAPCSSGYLGRLSS